MPDGPIVDAHVHLWDPRQFRLAWLDGDALLNRRYDVAEYGVQTADVAIAALVYVQVDAAPAYGLLEAQAAVAHAQQEDPRLQGIVAYAPVEDGEVVRSYLTALTGIGPLVKGVRRLIQAEPDPGFCLQPAFVRGVQLLPEFGFSFDLCVTHRQLASTIALVRQCPETQFVLDHLGKPAVAEHLLEPWREQIRELAALPNVLCKLSGLVTEADHQSWTLDDLAPYVTHVLDAFGEDRVMFGSDWPVVLRAASYRRWVETLDTLTAHLSAEARRKLWAGNARRFYRLAGA